MRSVLSCHIYVDTGDWALVIGLVRTSPAELSHQLTEHFKRIEKYSFFRTTVPPVLLLCFTRTRYKVSFFSTNLLKVSILA